MRMYISGKMSGLPDNNYPYFDEVENRLNNLYPGATIINPANIGRGLVVPEGLSEKEIYKLYLNESVKGLLTCNTIYMLKGWEDSSGARDELEYAIAMNYEVIYE